MTTVTGTVIAAKAAKGITLVDLRTGSKDHGSNGGERTERLVIAGEVRLAQGAAIRASGVYREDGHLVLQKTGRLEAVKRGTPTAPRPVTPSARPSSAPAVTKAAPVAPKAASAPAPAAPRSPAPRARPRSPPTGPRGRPLAPRRGGGRSRCSLRPGRPAALPEGT